MRRDVIMSREDWEDNDMNKQDRKVIVSGLIIVVIAILIIIAIIIG